VVGAAIGAVVAIVLGLPTVAISLRTLKSARQQYELAMQERTAVYRQTHYQAAVALAQEVKKALDDFLTNAVGRITMEQTAAFERAGRVVHQPLDDEARIRLRQELMPQLTPLYEAVGRADVIFDNATLQALGRVSTVFTEITAFGPSRARGKPELAETDDPAVPLADAGQAALKALRTELHSTEMSAELRARMTWHTPEGTEGRG